MDLEARVSVLEVKMEAADGLARRLLEEVGRLNGKVEALGLGLEQRFGQVDAQFTGVYREFATVHKEMAGLHKEMSGIHKAIAAQSKFLLALAIGTATFFSVVHPLVLRVLAQ